MAKKTTKLERLMSDLILEVAKVRHDKEEANRKKGWKHSLEFELFYMLGTIRLYPRLTAQQLSKITGRPLKEVRAAIKNSHGIVKKKGGYESKV